jgi:hypothetical protein
MLDTHPKNLLGGMASVYRSIVDEGTGVGGELQFYTKTSSAPNALTHMTVQEDGRVSMGMNATTHYKLVVTGNSQNDSVAIVHNTNLGRKAYWSSSSVHSTGNPIMDVGTDQFGGFLFMASGHPLRFATGGKTRMRIEPTGEVAIGDLDATGVPAPTRELEVNGDVRITAGVYDGSNNCLLGTCVSDRRFKLNIQPVQSALAKMNALTPVTYEFDRESFPDRNFSDQRETGLIAQEVEKVFPKLVATDKQGYKSVRYGLELQMNTIAALNELSARFEKLERKHSEDVRVRDRLIKALSAKLCQADPSDELCRLE